VDDASKAGARVVWLHFGISPLGEIARRLGRRAEKLPEDAPDHRCGAMYSVSSQRPRAVSWRRM
jgi:hypothetical protein